MKTLNSFSKKMLFVTILFSVLYLQDISARNQEKTLYVGYNYWTDYPIIEILPINDQLVKIVVLNSGQIPNSNIHYTNTFYYKKGQKLYQVKNGGLNYFFPLEKYKGTKSPKDHIVTILSFDYNYITIRQEDIVLSEEERARQMTPERINSLK